MEVNPRWAKPDADRLAPSIPSADFWASDPNRSDQVGCVYTAQGLEFDYVGVIWGRDLRWDPDINDWIGDPSSHAPSSSVPAIDSPTSVSALTAPFLAAASMGCYLFFDHLQTRARIASRLVGYG